MKKIIVFIIIMVTISTTSPVREVFDSDEYKILCFASHYTKHYRRYASCILRFSEKYGLDPLLIAKQIQVESGFYNWAKSKAGARGCSQIMSINKHLLFRVDEGRLLKHICKNNITNYWKYFYRIGYCIESQCIIMSNNLRRYGKYEYALIAYGYRKAPEKIRECKAGKRSAYDYSYVNKIMGDKK